jgi:hypothetical protein
VSIVSLYTKHPPEMFTRKILKMKSTRKMGELSPKYNGTLKDSRNLRRPSADNKLFRKEYPGKVDKKVGPLPY